MSSSVQDRRSSLKHMRLRNLLGGHDSKNRAAATAADDSDSPAEGGDALAHRPDIAYARNELRSQIRQAKHGKGAHHGDQQQQQQQQQQQYQSLHQHRNLDVNRSSVTEPRSPGGGAWSTSYDTREPHPLVNEVFPEPRHIAAFAEALRVDLGQQDVIAPSLLLADDHTGVRTPRSGFMSPREEYRDGLGASPASGSSLVGALWSRLPFGRHESAPTTPPSASPPSKALPRTPSPLDQAGSEDGAGRGSAAQLNLDSSLSFDQQDEDRALLNSTVGQEPSLTKTSHPRNVGRISAASDFAPVNERVRRRSKSRRRRVDSGGREGFLYQVLRFPLLVCIFLVIGTEFLLYVLVRQLVNLVEYLIAFRGKKGKLRKKLRAAQTWEEWKTAALDLDNHLGLQRWKEEDASGLYDWILVKKVVASLRTHRSKKDAEKVMEVLELCLKNNFAGVENFKLFSQTYFGSKNLVERFATEAEESLRYIHETDKISNEEKRSFYRRVAKNMGKSALCLSGGGSFGYYHIGVVRALLDANLLPKIISGTSAGGLIAALACTRTDEELKELLVPALADRITACEEPLRVWALRAYKTGARFDTVAWASKATFFTRGSTTFLEAYQRTGKILNVSVIPADRHSPVKLLNHLTSPHCIIWSALLASAAVPGLMNPVCLMQKTKDGAAIPYNLGHRFKDGSLRVDIPLEELHALFQVNYPIGKLQLNNGPLLVQQLKEGFYTVSQVNPHIHLFHFAPQGTPGRPVAHRRGKGWRGGFILSAVEHVLKLHLAMNFKIIRDLDLLPRLLGTDWSSVFLQRFTGAVTIIPRTRFLDWIRILSDPDRKELARMLRISQIVTFPKLHMIENRVRLENAVEAGRRACRRAARARQLQDGGSTPVTPSEGVARPVLNTLPSYLGSDTDHDDFFISSRRRSSHETAQGSRSRLREMHELTGVYDDDGRASSAREGDSAQLDRGQRRQLRGAGTDEEAGTSEDGDRKASDGGMAERKSRPTWLDRGDVLNSDEEGEQEADGASGDVRDRNGHSRGIQPNQRGGEHGTRGRTWSFARASAAFRNTFSPTKVDSPAGTELDRVELPPSRVELEEETSSGEEDDEV
ncbi:hypothetical protein OC842_006594, partial [Tilletia horrida]